MKSMSLFAASVATMLAGAVYTQDAAAQSAGAQADGVYLRAGLGGTFASDQDFQVEYGPTVLPVEPVFTETTFELGGGFVAAAAVGYEFDFIRTELEYRYASSDVQDIIINTADADAVDLGVDDDASLDAHLFFANVYFDFNNSSNFTPFIGGGAGGAVIGDDETDTVFAYQARAGVSYDFGGGLSGDLEYIYARTGELSIGPDETESFTFGGDRYESSSVMVSIRKKF